MGLPQRADLDALNTDDDHLNHSPELKIWAFRECRGSQVLDEGACPRTTTDYKRLLMLRLGSPFGARSDPVLRGRPGRLRHILDGL